jgi:hypothetical protein
MSESGAKTLVSSTVIACVLSLVLVGARHQNACVFHRDRVCPLSRSRRRDSDIWHQSRVHAIAMTGSPGDNSGEKKSVPPRSPSRHPRCQSRSVNSHSHTRHAGGRVIERVIERPSTNVVWPMLTRTNYLEWALVMEVNYQTLGVWEIV